MPDEKGELQKRYNSLSPELKEALFDEEITKKLREIGKESKIPENSMSDLVKISGKVFLKIISLPELTDELKEKLNIKEETAKKLSQDLNSEIFFRYKELLTKEEKEHPLLPKSQPKEKTLPQKNQEARAEESKDKIVKDSESESDKDIKERETAIEERRKEAPEIIPKESFEKKDDKKVAEEKIKKETPAEEKKEEKPPQKKTTDSYQEPIKDKEETDPFQVIKEKGKIKGIF